MSSNIPRRVIRFLSTSSATISALFKAIFSPLGKSTNSSIQPYRWWWCCGKNVNKGDKRFEDLIQTIANGEEEGCDDDETKWKRIGSNKVNNKESMLRFLGAPFRLCVICGRRSIVHQSTQK